MELLVAIMAFVIVVMYARLSVVSISIKDLMHRHLTLTRSDDFTTARSISLQDAVDDLLGRVERLERIVQKRLLTPAVDEDQEDAKTT